jgi:hypothetical protein
MKRAALLAALPAVLALGLVACGDDDDSVSTEPASPTATTTAREGSVEISVPDISVPDITIPDLSLPPDLTLPGGITIPENIGSILSNISIPDLSNISIPDLPTGISVPNSLLEQILRGALPNITDEQIDCVIDELGGKLDLQRLPDIAETCDIDLTRGG